MATLHITLEWSWQPAVPDGVVPNPKIPTLTVCVSVVSCFAGAFTNTRTIGGP